MLPTHAAQPAYDRTCTLSCLRELLELNLLVLGFPAEGDLQCDASNMPPLDAEVIKIPFREGNRYLLRFLEEEAHDLLGKHIKHLFLLPILAACSCRNNESTKAAKPEHFYNKRPDSQQNRLKAVHPGLLVSRRVALSAHSVLWQRRLLATLTIEETLTCGLDSDSKQLDLSFTECQS